MKENENLTEEQSVEVSADTLSAAMIFERLPEKTQLAILDLLRELHNIS